MIPIRPGPAVTRFGHGPDVCYQQPETGRDYRSIVARRPSNDRLEELLWDRHRTLWWIGILVGVHPSLVTYWFYEADIPLMERNYTDDGVQHVGEILTLLCRQSSGMLPAKKLRHGIEHDGPAVTIVPGVISGGTLLIAFALMALGVEFFWVTFIVGFGLVLPTALGIVASRSWTEVRECGLRSDQDSNPSREGDAPLETLRRRYAQGELSDAEFEHRVERLLESDTPENQFRSS